MKKYKGPLMILRLLLVLAVMGAGMDAHAWGRLGHEIVGAIAEQKISGTEAERHVARILHPNESLMSVATWADCVKGGEMCQAPINNEMQNFIRRFPEHKSFHYADVPAGLGHYREESIGARPLDIVHVLKEAILTLQHSPEARMGFTEREALFLLVHLMGDLHQPLHLGSLYLTPDGKSVVPQTPKEAEEFSTLGGNLLCVGSRPLHTLYDDEGPEKIKKALKRESVPDMAHDLVRFDRVPQFKDPKSKFMDWATESVELSRQILDLEISPERWSGDRRNLCGHSSETSRRHVWDVQFDRGNHRMLQDVSVEALRNAGLRLAGVLEALWP